MFPSRLTPMILRLAALGLAAGMTLALPAGAADTPAPAAEAKPETLRAPVYKALQGLQELIDSKKFKEAYDKVDEAERTPDKTEYEIFVINRNRGAIAARAGDTAIAGKAFAYVIDSKRLPKNEQLTYTLALAGMYYNTKDYPTAINWLKRYIADGGTDPQGPALLAQAYYLAGDFPNAFKQLSSDLAALEKAGKIPTEVQYQLQINSAIKMGNKPAIVAVLEKLVTYYPNNDRWSDYLQSKRARPGYPETALLDYYRLKQAIGIPLESDEMMDLADLALHAGLPAEAKKILDTGFQAGLLGKGKDAKLEKKTLDQATKSAADDLKTVAQSEALAQKAKDGLGLVNLGYALVTSGQYDKGIQLIQDGIHKGMAKRATEAKLHLGVAYYLAGRKADALATFQAIKENDTTGELARMWVLWINQSAAKPAAAATAATPAAK